MTFFFHRVKGVIKILHSEKGIFGNGNSVGLSDDERVITLTSGGPDMDPATADDNISLEVFRGPIY